MRTLQGLCIKTALPITRKLLKVAARICRIGSLLFLLLGPKNYQWCPYGIKRIGWVGITIVPNNELRASHIFYKYADHQLQNSRQFLCYVMSDIELPKRTAKDLVHRTVKAGMSAIPFVGGPAAEFLSYLGRSLLRFESLYPNTFHRFIFLWILVVQTLCIINPELRSSVGFEPWR